jgi:hypothetical protein
MKKLFLAFLLFPSIASAQYVGLSAFAARNSRFPCDAMLNIVANARYPAISVLWDSFGDDNTCLIRFLTAFRDRPHLIQIHPWNNVALRNRSTEPQMVFHRLSKDRFNRLLEARDPGTIFALQTRLAEMVNFVNAHGSIHTQCLISTGLEDNYTPKAFETAALVVRSVWPYLINRNPVGGRGGKQGMVWFLERHGRSPHAEVVNEDGAVNSLAQTKRILDGNKGALARFVWRPDHQGRVHDNKATYPRANREFEISARDERELGALLSRY